MIPNSNRVPGGPPTTHAQGRLEFTSKSELGAGVDEPTTGSKGQMENRVCQGMPSRKTVHAEPNSPFYVSSIEYCS